MFRAIPNHGGTVVPPYNRPASSRIVGRHYHAADSSSPNVGKVLPTYKGGPCPPSLFPSPSRERVGWGPGLRIYFGQDGNELIILLAGSEKRDQKRVIEKAKSYWNDYKQRKRSKDHGTD